MFGTTIKQAQIQQQKKLVEKLAIIRLQISRKVIQAMVEVVIYQHLVR